MQHLAENNEMLQTPKKHIEVNKNKCHNKQAVIRRGVACTSTCHIYVPLFRRLFASATDFFSLFARVQILSRIAIA